MICYGYEGGVFEFGVCGGLFSRFTALGVGCLSLLMDFRLRYGFCLHSFLGCFGAVAYGGDWLIKVLDSLSLFG